MWKLPKHLNNKKIVCFNNYYVERLYVTSKSDFNDNAPKKDFRQYFEIKPKFTRENISALTVGFNKIGILDVAKSKLYEVQSFYDDFSGMTAVKDAQNKVIQIQDQLQLVQERRRHILIELNMVRKKIQDIHIELQKCSRGDHRYVDLVRDEFDILTKEKEKTQLFQIVDQEERDLFSHLTSSVKTSHEKERTQANNVKYWSVIGSCVGALLGIIATTINYYYRSTQFENILKLSLQSIDHLEEANVKLSKLETDMATIRFYVQKKMDEEKRDKELARLEKLRPVPQTESWAGYFRRHSVNVYRYFIPIEN